MGNIEFFDELGLKINNKLDAGKLFTFNFKINQDIFRDIAQKINVASTDSILDLGGGTGLITQYIAPHCHQLTLADGAKNVLNSAKHRLKKYHNISYIKLDINELPLPFNENEFDKIICYSVVHYLDSFKVFEQLIKDLLRILKPHGQILIGDIPLSDKYQNNLLIRQKNPFKNFLLNQKYYFKINLTRLIYRLKKIDESQVRGISFTKDQISNFLETMHNASYSFHPQNKKLYFADSREDLIIIKK